MATFQVKLGVLILLVAAALVGTTVNGACVYVVEAETSAAANTQIEFTAYAKICGNQAVNQYFTIWKRSSNVKGLDLCPVPLYQFIVSDALNSCIQPCRLIVEKASSGTGTELPQSVRIRGYQGGVENFVKTFAVPVILGNVGAEVNECV